MEAKQLPKRGKGSLARPKTASVPPLYKPFYTTMEAAEILGVYHLTLRNWLRAGKVYADGQPLAPIAVVGQTMVWYREQLVALILGAGRPDMPVIMGTEDAAAYIAERLEGGFTPRMLAHWQAHGELPPGHEVAEAKVYTKAMLDDAIAWMEDNTEFVNDVRIRRRPEDRYIVEAPGKPGYEVVGLGRRQYRSTRSNARVAARQLGRTLLDGDSIDD